MNGKAIASFVLGIASFFISWFGFLTAVVGIVLGMMARREIGSGGEGAGVAISGIIINGISILLNVLLLVLGIAFLGMFL
ncbi:DUF4190 domain-containing protein [Geomicrobium sp. JSM 1781026]|uniref:DUF4190 domain-containing protein n=1 Tax=Geomicrobium sp. JSM 1781026 TaxID=3344580 RepID=UPI0035C092BE